MYLLIAVINDEEILEELITGWVDIGITEATVVDTTDFLQLISYNIPIFAGFRTLTSGGMPHNKTIFTTISDKTLLEHAVSFLKSLCEGTQKSHLGNYLVAPLIEFGLLGQLVDEEQHQKHVEKKIGRRLKS